MKLGKNYFSKQRGTELEIFLKEMKKKNSHDDDENVNK